MTMEHAERRRWVREIARLNERTAGGPPRHRDGLP